MRVKRYVVDSMPDALQKIRSDLGKDAVILNTKEIRSGGFLGLFGKKRIEVIAATDAHAPQPAATPASAASAFSKALAQAAQAQAPQTNTAARFATNEAYSAPASAGFSSPVAVMEPEIPKHERASDDQQERLLAEMKQMRELMAKLAVQQKTSTSDPYPEPLEELRKRLLDQEIAPELVSQMIDEAFEEGQLDSESSWTDERAKELIRKKLQSILESGEERGLRSDTRIVHFVGPTGVGKTTTIAKLAAEQVLKHNRKVGFITSDTYRIAAVEQLKTYATILNVPLEVVFSPQELTKAFAHLEDRDIIFMDTAGRNFRNQMYVSELNSLLASQGNSETFLVLSLTAKYKDMQEITRNFARFKLDKVLFTKKDETQSYGTIVNLLQEFPVTLSYLTDGQNVPDDISEANTDRIIDLILEGDVHE
jgi:flagellar biosynthesis protein FlhF